MYKQQQYRVRHQTGLVHKIDIQRSEPIDFDLSHILWEVIVGITTVIRLK